VNTRCEAKGAKTVTATPQPIWSHKVSAEHVPEAGLHVDLQADEATRAALAKAAGLRDLPRLVASLDVTRYGRGGLRVDGDLSATVGQTCVVSLEPVENELNEPIDVVFGPSAGGSLADESGEATMRFGDAELPEPLVGGEIDLGAIVTEFLMLGIDPYPRKEGVEFEGPRQTDDPAGHPFAALAALKKVKGGEDL
jgi:uncharacterized metal-binding protein YceD (DUF177 family)